MEREMEMELAVLDEPLKLKTNSSLKTWKLFWSFIRK